MKRGFDSLRPHHDCNPQKKYMKKSKSLIAFAVVSLLAAGFAFAADKKDDKAAAKVAKCCADAKAKDGKACAHACCVESAKAGNNCTKCGGSGAMAKEAKK
jgi:hypothetical protein